MTGTGKRILHFAAAIVLACALVLESFTIAFAFSEGGARIRLDGFGNPICNGVLNHGDDGTGGPNHARLPPCCVFGCSMFAPLLTGPSGSIFTERSSPGVRLILFPTLPRIYIRAAAYDPGNPRAPPVI